MKVGRYVDAYLMIVYNTFIDRYIPTYIFERNRYQEKRYWREYRFKYVVIIGLGCLTYFTFTILLLFKDIRAVREFQ